MRKIHAGVEDDVGYEERTYRRRHDARACAAPRAGAAVGNRQMSPWPLASPRPLGRAGWLALVVIACLSASPVGHTAEDCEGSTPEGKPCATDSEASSTPPTRCPRGSRRVGGECRPVAVPEFGSLNASGNDFTCWRGYVRQDERCVRLNVPDNAQLDGTGQAWTCVRGYRQRGESCERIEVPSNASLDESGNDWACWRGFRRTRGACARIQVPPYASLTESGDAWECWTGYRMQNNACVQLDRQAYGDALEAERAARALDDSGTRDPDATGSPTRRATEREDEPEPVQVRAAGLCGDEYVVGTLAASGDTAEGTLGGESGASFRFEGRRSEQRVEGRDDRNRDCTLILNES